MASRDRSDPNGSLNDCVVLAISVILLAIAVRRSTCSAIVRWVFTVSLAFIVLHTLYMRWAGRWKPYDPTWLVDLANEQANSDGRWLVEALKKCRMAATRGEYIYFLNPRRIQPADIIHLHHPRMGEVVLHLTAGKQIACVELRDKYLNAVVVLAKASRNGHRKNDPSYGE